MARVGLAPRAAVLAAALSHGERRALEIACVLAQSPRWLLLDEPLAGMGQEEGAGVDRPARALKGQVAMLLVEHDMEAVFACRASGAGGGSVVACGPPASVRADAAVRACYLGEE